MATSFDPHSLQATLAVAERRSLENDAPHALHVYSKIGISRQAGLEPTTCGLEDRCSIQLSYWRLSANYTKINPESQRARWAMNSD